MRTEVPQCTWSDDSAVQRRVEQRRNISFKSVIKAPKSPEVGKSGFVLILQDFYHVCNALHLQQE